MRSLVSSLVTRKNHDGPASPASPVGSEVTDRRSKCNDSSSMLCPILVDPKNIEAVAAAFILQALLRPLLLNRLMLADVLKEDMEVPQDTRAALMVCSDLCFLSGQVQSWLLQASRIPTCYMIPIIADDNFLVPSPSFFTELVATSSTSSLNQADLFAYMQVVKALFQEIAIIFVPQNSASTIEDLELRANKTAARLLVPLQPMTQKISRLSTTQSMMSGDSNNNRMEPCDLVHRFVVPFQAVVDVETISQGFKDPLDDQECGDGSEVEVAF